MASGADGVSGRVSARDRARDLLHQPGRRRQAGNWRRGCDGAAGPLAEPGRAGRLDSAVLRDPRGRGEPQLGGPPARGMRPPAWYLGTFLAGPLDVPTEVINYAAEQLGIADPSYVKRYTERRTTRFEHAKEIRRAFGLPQAGSGRTGRRNSPAPQPAAGSSRCASTGPAVSHPGGRSQPRRHVRFHLALHRHRQGHVGQRCWSIA